MYSRVAFFCRQISNPKIAFFRRRRENYSSMNYRITHPQLRCDWKIWAESKLTSFKNMQLMDHDRGKGQATKFPLSAFCLVLHWSQSRSTSSSQVLVHSSAIYTHCWQQKTSSGSNALLRRISKKDAYKDWGKTRFFRDDGITGAAWTGGLEPVVVKTDRPCIKFAGVTTDPATSSCNDSWCSVSTADPVTTVL